MFPMWKMDDEWMMHLINEEEEKRKVFSNPKKQEKYNTELSYCENMRHLTLLVERLDAESYFLNEPSRLRGVNKSCDECHHRFDLNTKLVIHENGDVMSNDALECKACEKILCYFCFTQNKPAINFVNTKCNIIGIQHEYWNKKWCLQCIKNL